MSLYFSFIYISLSFFAFYSIKEHNRDSNISRYMLHSLAPGGGYTTSKSCGPGGPVCGRVRSISATIKSLTRASCTFPFLVLRAPITRLNCPVNGQSRTFCSTYPRSGYLPFTSRTTIPFTSSTFRFSIYPILSSLTLPSVSLMKLRNHPHTYHTSLSLISAM